MPGMMKTLTKAMAMPPMEGMAMGLATSAPAPVDQRMGTRPMKVVAAKQLGFVPQPNLIN